MSIQKPYAINLQSQTVDANKDITVSWKTSGSISTHFAIAILDNTDNSPVWSLPKTSSYATKYTIPAGTLTNGKQLKLTIQIWDATSATTTSDPIIFATSSTPVVTVDIIPTIASPSYTFTATYSQAESVGMRSWIAYLYDLNGNILLESGIRTSSDISWLIDNLQSETSYQIEFIVTSNNGLVSSSGKINFSALFTTPSVYTSLTAENVDNAGIKLNMSVIRIVGETENEPIFLDSTKIDLLNDRMIFSDGFSVSKNFSLKLWIENPVNKEDLIILQGLNGQYKLQYHWLDNRFHLYKVINNLQIEYVSEEVTSGNYFVGIQQIGSDCNLIALENI